MAENQKNLELWVSSEMILPDNKQWENRMEIKSSTSDRLYIVSQNIKKRHWGCSCPAWRIRRTCKHLLELGLAPYEQPQEIEVHYG